MVYQISGDIGLASATSQLDRNAWQRVATYKSGSKQTWRRISSLHGITSRKHRRVEHHQTPDQLPLCWTATARFFWPFFSSASDSVLYSKFLCHVFRRAAVSLSVVLQHCCLEEDPLRPSVSIPRAVLCVMDFLSLVLVGHSTGKTHETMKRRQLHQTSTSNDFHEALFVDEYQRPSIDVCTIGNISLLETNLPNPILCST